MNIMEAILAIALLAVIATAQQVTPKPQKKLAIADSEVKQLLLLMDTDKNGKISREEFLKFMEAEFERLDQDRSGELDVKELTQSQLRVIRRMRPR